MKNLTNLTLINLEMTGLKERLMQEMEETKKNVPAHDRT